MHRYLLHNGGIYPTSERVVSPGQVGFMNGWGVFSTLRVIDGVLFAYERHWRRMQRDAVRMRVPLGCTSGELHNSLLRLVDANQAWNATLRVAIVRNRGGAFEGAGIDRDSDVVAFTTDLKNWGETIALGIVENARHAASEFAGAKITSWVQNLVMYERALANGLDEVLLLNERREVSECTSANVFAATDGVAATPPLSSGCLGGITREVLLDSIHVSGWRIEERTLTVEDLERAESVFITSSTRNLLPVREIRGLKIRLDKRLLQPLAEAFDKYQSEYARSHAGAVEEIGHAPRVS